MYFVFVILLGSFYLVNLILAIVAMSYGDTQKQDLADAEEEAAERQVSITGFIYVSCVILFIHLFGRPAAIRPCVCSFLNGLFLSVFSRLRIDHSFKSAPTHSSISPLHIQHNCDASGFFFY